MSVLLISPSGKVLVRRARCDVEPGPDPLPVPVLIAGLDEREVATADPNTGKADGGARVLDPVG